ncbi:hypothetical protein [Klugiella xanthotipulae]|nr:hypothetical protein [Klugiella xanthotipulae]
MIYFFFLREPGVPYDGYAFFVGFFVASTVYAGVLWRREKLDPRLSVWGWAWRDVLRPRYLRLRYRESLKVEACDSEVGPAVNRG